MIQALLLAAAFGAPPGEIAFLNLSPSASGGRIEILSLESGTVREAGPEGALDAPRWSPDGRQLAFTVRVEAGSAIFIADAGGRGGRLLQHADPLSHGPAWSPKGTRLAYTAAGEGLDAQITVYDLAADRETTWGGGRTSLMSPMWLPNRLARLLLDPDRQGAPSFIRPLPRDRRASELLVATGLTGAPGATATGLFIVSERDANPLSESLLPSTGPYAEFAPAVAPEALAFESNDGGDREIFVLSRRKTFDLSNHRAADWSPVWSPDARWLAFESFRSGTRGIYRCLAREATSVEPVATDPAGDCWAPAWSPDGQWLAFVSDAAGHPAVYIVRADGTERQRVSPDNVWAEAPSWRPVP